ncbi:MAG: CYTH domain-containing protein [Desulfobacula sp.]|nr:CYTH domain-containing protein [Desulfobacula sp.]
MGIEIEKKYLLKSDAWRKLAKGNHYRQGYLNSYKERTVRVRTVNDKGFLTIKGISVGATRLEFEYEIPKAECNIMLEELVEKPFIEKCRYKIDYKGNIWEIDEFFGENQGLIVAEVELESEEQKIEIPEWIGEEVTGDPKYFNSNLIKHPYAEW